MRRGAATRRGKTLLRRVLLALLLWLLVGFAIGTALRLRLERPVEYIGQLPAPAPRERSLRPPERVASGSALIAGMWARSGPSLGP